MGEIRSRPFQLFSNTSLTIGFQGLRMACDGGLCLVGNLDEELGPRELIEQHLRDTRRGKNTQVPVTDPLRLPA